LVVLVFGPDVRREELSLSGAASSGDHLFLAPDEGESLIRLTRNNDDIYDQAAKFRLADLVDLPGQRGDELDLEGLAISNAYLWAVGSHSAVRKRVKDNANTEEVVERLRTVEYPAGRRALLRIPLDEGGTPAARVEDAPDRVRTAASTLGMNLRELLEGDPHIGPFLALPGKDNGLDVEGLAVLGERVMVGLRGPVLRGWAVVVELAPTADPTDARRLIFGPIEPGSPDRYRLHFLDLGGLGVRDLAPHGDDLLVLAGPTMILDGPSRIVRVLRGAITLPAAVHGDQIQVAAELPPREMLPGPGQDHAEAITILEKPNGSELLVVYDSPGKARLSQDGVEADSFDIVGPLLKPR
jgi:hypothetical protein